MDTIQQDTTPTEKSYEKITRVIWPLITSQLRTRKG